MKKVILIIGILILTTGCTAEYNLEIDDLESFTYNETGYISSENLEDINMIYNSEWPTNAYIDEEYSSESTDKIEGVDYYDVKSYEENGYYIVKYNFNFPSDRFGNSAGVKTGFYDFKKTYNEEDDIVTLDTGNFYYEKFPELDKLTINIKINNPVLSHNALSIDNNVYTWVFNKNELKNARIILSYKKNDNANSQKADNIRFLIGVFIFLGFMIFIIVLNIFNNRKKVK